MTRQLDPIEIGHLPDVVRLVEQVQSAQVPRVLRRNNKDVAVLLPAPARKRRRDWKPSKADLEIAFSFAGGWAGLVDGDKLIADIYADRSASNRVPPAL